MSALVQLKKLVRAADFFFSTEMLRVDDQLQYKTLTGGIVSLGIIITIIIGFASMILDTLALNSFTITTENIKNAVPASSVVQINNQSPFRFAIQVWRHNLTDSKRYFDVTFRLDYQVYGTYNKTTYFPLVPCTKEFFKDYSEITNNFQTLQSNGWLCPTLNTSLYLEGKYSTANYNQYVIQASVCKNETDPSRPCASPQEIEKYFQQKQNFFYFVIYFTNTQINPDKKEYKHYYIEDQSYALFGSNLGSEVFLQFTDYTVKTDYSIWPFSKVVTDSGCFAQDTGTNRPFQTNINGTYITWSFIKSANSIYYYRQVQKLSIIFSFMGGMIGAISALLFIIKVYTNVAFQFSIAFQIFTPKDLKIQHPLETEKDLNDRNTKKLKTKHEAAMRKRKNLEQMSMNFFTFLRFYLYKLFDLLHIQYDAPEIKYAQQCKEEILKQLDVKKLLKRIIFIEHCLTKILDDYHLDVLQLKKPETPQEIREIRLKCESIVDQQLSDDESIETDKVSLSQLKQVVGGLNQNLETPNPLLRQIEKQPKAKRLSQSQSQTDNPLLRKQRSLPFSIKNDVIIQNIDEIKSEITQHGKNLFKELDSNQKAKMGDMNLKKKKKRESNLVQLLNTAEEGNQISNRIWKKLDNTTKKRAVRISSRQQFS